MDLFSLSQCHYQRGLHFNEIGVSATKPLTERNSSLFSSRVLLQNPSGSSTSLYLKMCEYRMGNASIAQRVHVRALSVPFAKLPRVHRGSIKKGK